jgi:hypothetical protein
MMNSSLSIMPRGRLGRYSGLDVRLWSASAHAARNSRRNPVLTVTGAEKARTGAKTMDTFTKDMRQVGLAANLHEYEHYGLLLIMAVLSFVSMYVLMYAMVDRASNIYPNLNQFYMAGLMTAPMIVIEVVLMRAMYHNGRVNFAIIIASLAALAAFFIFIRQQSAIGDEQFLRSMIPHHAGAILMCEKASIRDPEIAQLCARIISGQQSEIDQMKAIIDRLAKRP